MKAQKPPGEDMKLRLKRVQERVSAVLKEEKFKIALPVKIVPGPDGWVKPVASIQFVPDKE